MKKQLLIIVSAAIAMASCQTSKPKPSLDAVTIEAISFQTETMFNISCEKFDTYYQDKWHKTVLDKPKQLDSLQNLLDAQKTADSGYEPNVRVKLLLSYKDGSADTVCLDEKITHYKNANYETSVELANFVQR